jgi:hypothetical protein
MKDEPQAIARIVSVEVYLPSGPVRLPGRGVLQIVNNPVPVVVVSPSSGVQLQYVGFPYVAELDLSSKLLAPGPSRLVPSA